MTRRPRSDRGASAVEYGLIVAGVVGAFLAASIALQSALGGLFGRAISSIEHDPGPSAPSSSSAPIVPLTG